MGGLIIERVNGRGASFVRLSGRIDDTFDGAQLGPLDTPLAFELGNVTAITSYGVRGFTEAMKRVRGPAYLVDTPPCIVDQVNLIANFLGLAEVLTARAYFSCACGEESLCTIDLLADGARIRAGRPPEALCPRCGAAMRLAEDETFRFATHKGARKLDPTVAAMLAQLGLYHSHALEDRPLRVRKVVDGADVGLRLDGAFVEQTRLQRVADDDGIVALQVGGLIVRGDGAESFQTLIGALCRAAKELVIVDMPPQLAGLVGAGALHLGPAKVASLLVPVRCDPCGEPALASSTLHQAGTALRCPRCGEPALPIIAPAAIEVLRKSGAPSPEAVALIEKLEGLFSQAAVEAKLIAQPRSNADSEMPSQIGGYRILRPLSSGGMADVLLATRPSLGGVEKLVALKRFRRELFRAAPAAIAMFLAEARLAAQLSHPNVVQIFDVGEADGDLYMAMELIDGRDLRELVDTGEPTPPHVAAFIGVEIARALAYLHDAKDLRGRPLRIVHRDVSPQNVLVDRSGRVVLIDFGVALAGEGELQKHRRKVAGNLAYMSPEQCYGEPLDRRSDLFSLGATLWELLAGAALYRRHEARDTRAALLSGEVPPLPKAVPPQLEALVRRLLAQDRERRPVSAEVVARELDAMMNELGGRCSRGELGAYVSNVLSPRASIEREERQSAASAAERAGSGRSLRYAGIALLLALLGLLVVWLLTRGHRRVELGAGRTQAGTRDAHTVDDEAQRHHAQPRHEGPARDPLGAAQHLAVADGA